MVTMELNKIYNEDCLEGMKRIPDGSVDCIVCDLPYGTTSCSWDSVLPFDKLWEQYHRVLKMGGVVLLFGSARFSTSIRTINTKDLRDAWIWK